MANVKRRVRRFGYEARMADDVLQVPDPNGRWLELKAAPENWMCCDFVVEPKIGVDDWKLVRRREQTENEAVN